MTIDRDRRMLWLMAAPFLTGVALLVVGPALVTLVSSLSEWDLVNAPRWIGLGNFRELFSDDLFRIALENSLWHVAIAVPLSVAAALGLALLLQKPAFGVGTARGAVVLPALLPDAAAALAWLWILNPLTGPLNLVLAALGLPTPSWLTEPGPARWAVVVMGSFSIGAGFLVAFAARRSVPDGVYELAAAQGAGPWSRWARVTAPLVAPALLLVACLAVVSSLQTTFVPALLVTEGGPPPHATTYLSLFVYRNAFEYLRYGYAAAATVWMIAVTAAIVWLMFRVVKRWRGGLVEPLSPS
jgi:multiple sugar transport system permease protein